MENLPKGAFYREFPSTHGRVNMVYDDPCRAFEAFK
jgi:hypothetical protein